MPAGHHGVNPIGPLPGSVTGVVGRVGWLEDWRIGAALLAVAAAVTASWFVLAVRSRRRGRRLGRPVLRRVGLGTLVTLTFLAGTGVLVNSYAGYAPDLASLERSVPSLIGARDSGPTTVDAGSLGTGGQYPARLFSLRLSDPADRIPPGRNWVYLPAGYADPANAHRRYPVAYVLHGYPSSSYDWFGAGRLATSAALLQRQGLLRPMILVSPDVSGGTVRDTECMDSSVGGPRIETFLTRTVVTTIDRRYRTLADRSDRVLGGVSAGGFCALNVGLRHQQEFAEILGLMPYGDPGRNAEEFMFHGDPRLVRLNSPDQYVATMPIRRPQSVFIAAGLGDPVVVASARELARELAARGLYVGLRIDPAGYGHTWREARREVPYALAFASAHLGPARPVPAAPVPMGPLDRPSA
jgi:enterochelin esterase-like enzyme